MPARHLIFVYGTLKRGFCREGFLAGQQFLGEVRTQPIYRIYDCGTYPGLKPAVDGLSIFGELWEVDSACLARLDREEGVAEGLYSRSAVELVLPCPESAEPTPVEAYFYGPTVEGFRDCGECWTH